MEYLIATVGIFFCLMIRRPPRSTLDRSSAASDVYKRQGISGERSRRWTEAEKEYLRNNYKTLPIRTLAAELERTEKAVISFAEGLKLFRRNPYPSKKQKV